MTKYSYVAVDKDGKMIRGEYEGANRNAVVDFLHQKGMVVVNVDESLKMSLKDIFNIQIGGVPLTNKVVFSKQLATMLSAGLPLLQALDILTNQEKNAGLKSALERVVKLVEGGSSLSKALAKEKGVYSEVELNLIAAGEQSGNLVEMVQQVADNLEKRKDFNSRIRSAMIYPAILLVAAVGVVFVLMLFMIPSVSTLYEDFDADLPGITKFLINVSNFFVGYWWIVVILLIGIVAGIRYYYTTPSGREVIDRILLYMPIFGDLTKKIHISEFSRLLSMLLKSGISILEALNIVGNALNNIHFKKALKDAAREVETGVPLAVPISKNEDFPMIVSRIIATGENTGKLDKVLYDIHRFYQAEVDYMTANLTKLMEPVILIFVGGLVAFIALVVYSPIYKLAEVIG